MLNGYCSTVRFSNTFERISTNAILFRRVRQLASLQVGFGAERTDGETTLFQRSVLLSAVCSLPSKKVLVSSINS